MKKIFVFMLMLLSGLVGGYRLTTIGCQQILGAKTDMTAKVPGEGGNDILENVTENMTGAEVGMEGQAKAVEIQMTTRERIAASSCQRLEATAFASSEKDDYPAAYAVDSSETTSWQENVSGDGIGEYLEILFEGTSEVRYLILKLGNWESDEKYGKNGVPSVMTVSGNGFEVPLRFGEPETRGEYCIEFPNGLVTDYIRFTIKEVYNNGTGWKDTCISEIEAYGK